MPTTRSTAPINRSGLQRSSQPSKHKRSNTDEHARKRLKDDEINSNIDEEEQKQKTKGGRSGKKAKPMKKMKHLRSVSTPPCLWHCANQIYRKTSLDKAREEVAAKEAAKAYT